MKACIWLLSIAQLTKDAMRATFADYALAHDGLHTTLLVDVKRVVQLPLNRRADPREPDAAGGTAWCRTSIAAGRKR